MNKRKLALIFMLALGFILANSNYQFQFELVHAGDWEMVAHIDGMDDLNTGDQMVIEGELVSQRFALADSITNFVDVTQSVTYGSTTAEPPAGMGVDDAAHTTLQEASYVSYGYPTVTSYTGGSLPSGWYNYQWTFGASYASITGISLTNGQFWTDQYDMSAYTGVRVKFDWKNNGFENTEYDDLYCVSAETGDVTWFHSPAGRQNTFKTEQRDSGWDSTNWRVRWYAQNLDGDVESWEGFDIDNIYLYGQTSTTYYRFEAVFRFDSITHTYATERLYIDYDAGTSQEALQYYGGTTTDPTDYIGGTSGAEPDTNFDISDELTGTPFYVKIRDLTRTDGDQDSWLIDRLYIIVTNNPPTNDGTPTVFYLDDVDNLYSRYRRYEITTYHKDLDGYANIDYVVMSIQTAEEVTQFQGSFDQDTHIFTEGGTTEQKSYWELDTAESTYSESVNDLDITWKFWVEWECPDIVNLNIYCYVCDPAPSSDSDDYPTTWDIETDLEYDVVPSITDDDAGIVDRGDLDEAFLITGDVCYQDSTLAPSSDDVDIWVACTVGGYGTNVGPWEDDILRETGVFDVTCYADDEVGIETYTIKVVKEGAGYSGTDLIAGADPTDTYIADQIIIQTTVVDDARLDVDANAEIRVTARLAYTAGGEVWLGSGDTIVLNGVEMSWDAGNSWFELARTKGFVGAWKYFVNSSAEASYGITTLDLNSQEVDVIWDALTFDVYFNNDRYNLGASITVTVDARYAYDGTVFTDYNSGAISFTGSGWGGFTYSSETELWTSTKGAANMVYQGDYYMSSYTDGLYGLTKITSGFWFDGSEDRLSIPHDSSQTALTDFTIEGWFYMADNPSGTENIIAKAYGAQRQFRVCINADEQILFVWKNVEYYSISCSPTGLAVSSWHHFVITVDGSTNLNAWYDGIQYREDYTMTEGLKQQDVAILIGCRYYSGYDTFFHGYILQLRMYSRALTDVECYAHYQRHYESDANLVFALTGSGLRGNAGTYGEWIDSTANNNDATAYNGAALTQNSGGDKHIKPIWDAIGVNMWIDDGRDNIDDTITVYAWLTYLYDGTNVTDGTVLLNGTGMSYSSQVWSLGRSQASAGLWAYNITSISGNVYGITVIGTQYFDMGGDDIRFSATLDVPEFITVTAWVNFRSYPASGLATILNKGSQAANDHLWLGLYNHSGVYKLFWELGNGTTRNTIGLTTPSVVWTPDLGEWYHIVATYDASTGWAKLYLDGVLFAEENFGFDVIGSNVYYMYIGSYRGNTDHNLNGTVGEFSIYNRTLGALEIFELYQGRYSNNADLILKVNMASIDYADDTWYDLSNIGNDGAITSNGGILEETEYLYVRPIWDSYTCIITVGDNRVDVDTNATISFTVLSDYDSIAYDGTVSLNYTTYEHSSVQRQGYTLIALTGDDSYDITSLTNDDDYVIWDAIGINMWISDGRDDIDDTITVSAWLTYLYDGMNVTDGTVLLNGTGMSYSSQIWFLGRSQSTVGMWAYNITSVSGNTYGITTIGSHFFDGEGNDYVGIAASVDFDGIPEMTVAAWVNPSLIVGDYRIILGFTGAYHARNWEIGITPTGEIWFHISNGTHSHSISYGSVPLNTWSLVSARYIEGELLAVGINGVGTSTTPNIDMTYLAYQLSLGAYSYGQYDWFNGYIDEVRLYNRSLSDVEIFELYQKRYSNETGLVLHLNMASLDYADGTWYDLSNNGHDGTIYGSTVNATVGSNYVRPIWDSLTITITGPTDQRNNINTNATGIYVSAVYDYDGEPYDGTLVLNSTTFSYATMQKQGYTVSSASGDSYGITVISTNDDTYHIWDEIEVYWSTVFDSRDNVGEQNYPCFRLRLKYDNHLLNDGTNDAININGSAASWYVADGYWYKFYTMDSVGSWNFVVTSASENTYGITALDSASAITYDIDIIWDRVIFTTNVNMTWTVIGYYVNVSYTGTYEYDSTPWSGYATVANTSLTTGGAVHHEELTFTTVANKTFYATAIEDAGGYDLTAFTTSTVWCVFDDVVPDGAVAHHWDQYSPTQVHLIWGYGSNWMWDYNDTLLEVSVILHAYSNSSDPEASGGTYGSGAFGGLTVGPYNPAWDYVDLDVNCEVTVGGVDYDWVVWTQILDVEILHTIQTNVWYLYREGDYYSLLFHSNYENASAMVWDDMTDGTGYGDATYYGNYEGMHEWLRDTTIGMHNVTILINAGGDKGTVDRNYVENDLRLWYNFTYVISPAILSITNPVYTASEEQNFLSGETNVGCDWYAYNNNTEMDTGVLGTGSFAIDWNKNTTVGYYVWGVKFDDGSTIRWVNGTFEVDVITYALDWDFGLTETNVFVTGYQTIVSDYTIYEDDVQIGSGSITSLSFWLEWERQMAEDPLTVDVAVKFISGSTTIWTNFSYTEVQLMVFRVEVYNFYLTDVFVNFYVRSTWNNATIYAYDNSSLVGSFSEGAFFWYKDTDYGLHLLELNVTSGSDVITLNPAYFIPVWSETALAVTTFSVMNMQENHTLLTITSNWQNCTVDVYLNSTIIVSNAIEGMINMTRPTNVGLYNLTIVMDGGAQTKTLQGWIYISELDVSYDYSTYSSMTYVDEEGDTYVEEGDTYENPVGWYMDQQTVAILAVGGIVVIFMAYLTGRELKQGFREKVEANYAQ